MKIVKDNKYVPFIVDNNFIVQKNIYTKKCKKGII